MLPPPRTRKEKGLSSSSSSFSASPASKGPRHVCGAALEDDDEDEDEAEGGFSSLETEKMQAREKIICFVCVFVFVLAWTTAQNPGWVCYFSTARPAIFKSVLAVHIMI